MLLRSRVAACLSPLIACLPITPAAAQDTDDVAVGSGDIVVLGMRRARSDGTLSSDIATRTLSQSSRSIERDLLTAAGTYRLSDALELVSGVSNQNNRGGVMDNFAIRGFLGTPDGGAEYYVDGFLANRGMGPPRDPATTERIELLKGPAARCSAISIRRAASISSARRRISCRPPMRCSHWDRSERAESNWMRPGPCRGRWRLGSSWRRKRRTAGATSSGWIGRW